MAKASKQVAKRSEKMERLAAYAKVAKGGGGSIIGKLLRFNKGEYSAGQDDEEIALGTKMVFNTDSVLVGWTRWEDNKPVEQNMGPIVEGFQPEPRGKLGFTDQSEWESFDDGKPRDPWQFGNQMLMKSVGKKPELFTFTVGSKGGLGAIGKLLDAYTNEGREDEYPIITLGKEFYIHPVYKKVWLPSFKIVGWQSVDDWAIATEEDAPAARKASPAKKGGRKQLSY